MIKAINKLVEGVSRRDFLKDAAGSGALLALSPATASAEATNKEPGAMLAPRGPRVMEPRTFFFNLSHEQYTGHAYYLVLGKHRPRLREVGPGDAALASVRLSNRFLAAIPQSQITHMVEKVEISESSMHLGYLLKDPDTSSGEWQMSGIFLLAPLSGYPAAFARMRAKLAEGAQLALSAKRKKYGLPAASSLQDLLDEQALLDSTDWATAMVNLHMELLSAEPASGTYIQAEHIHSDLALGNLATVLEAEGPAEPEQNAAQDNSTGWATLVPLADDDGTPLRSTKGHNKGLILYNPRWKPQINQQYVALVIRQVLPGVKNDTTLGADVSNSPTSGIGGTIWNRKDGVTSVDQSPGATGASGSNATYTLKCVTPEQGGYQCLVSTTGESGSTTVKLSAKNWYLRYLGVWLQFFDGANKPVPVSKLPPGLVPNNPHVTSQEAFLVGGVNPEFTLYGIPLQPASFSMNFAFPSEAATTAKILSSGLGYGSHTSPETEQEGVIMTSLFNLAIPPALIALGVAEQIPAFVTQVFLPVALAVAKELALLGTEGTPGQIFTVFWTAVVRGFSGGGALSKMIKAFLTQLTADEVVDAVQDAIPIAGAVLQAIAGLAAIAEVTETSVEVLLSPWTYEYDLVGTYDLSLDIYPGTSDPGGFPAAAATYKVVASFDGGTPNVQTLNMPGAGTKALPPVVFRGVPLGGKVTVTVGFYAQDGTQVGHGTTGSISNLPPAPKAALPAITITEESLPINSSTTYQHKQKIVLDPQGRHQWVCGPAPAAPANPSACDPQPGNICQYRSISYSAAGGNVGYGWQSYNQNACGGGAAQLDQMANLPVVNTGSSAQGAYATLPCSLVGAGLLVYDPLGRATEDMNFYIDTTNQANLVRQVQLNPAIFNSPLSSNVWGKFNLTPNDMLLHPSGVIVTINNGSSKMESLKLPPGPVSDLANVLLANVHGGPGTRPGLFDGPTVATINAEGVVLVVEQTNNRIHAVDANGNPVRLFAKQPEPYFLYFSETGNGSVYLDIAVEFSGYIYVLSYSSSVYRLDIYHGDQTGTSPISTTMGFNAAKVTVDYWRNVYSLNYEVLTVNGALPAGGVTEPSISQWLPTAPPPCDVVASTLAAFQGPKSPRLFRRRDLWQLASNFIE